MVRSAPALTRRVPRSYLPPKDAFVQLHGGDEQIHTFARKGLKEDKPDAYTFLDQFNWTPDDMAEVMVQIQDGKSPEEAAKAWVDGHEEKVNEWLKGTNA
ncbi:glycine betaine ABC transporter substrate-binding protein [Paenibacillus humicola]|uniref:glycine betaine ABC transporter substrate-binding protein n=1 Tax=Paenibacillus humicola TaxID=3110540 RepID=UPI0030842491